MSYSTLFFTTFVSNNKWCVLALFEIFKLKRNNNFGFHVKNKSFENYMTLK